MRFEEFEKAKLKHLRREAKSCFSRYQDPNTGGLDKPALLLEAQLYMNEMDRRHGSYIAWRALALEMIVIALIGWEIVMGYRAERLQTTNFDAEQVVFENLQQSSAATAQTLSSEQSIMQSMNDRLAVELGRMSQITLEFSLSGTKASISNQGNVDLQFWGFKVADMPARINKRSVLLKRSASIEVDGIASDIHKAIKGEIVQVYIRDDFNNEFVAEDHMGVGPNIQGYGGRLEVVQRRWSNK
jgi:hypothetical protein